LFCNFRDIDGDNWESGSVRHVREIHEGILDVVGGTTKPFTVVPTVPVTLAIAIAAAAAAVIHSIMVGVRDVFDFFFTGMSILYLLFFAFLSFILLLLIIAVAFLLFSRIM
jgi:hypothetical protein